MESGVWLCSAQLVMFIVLAHYWLTLVVQFRDEKTSKYELMKNHIKPLVFRLCSPGLINFLAKASVWHKISISNYFLEQMLLYFL
jgi:hypothetical protein